MKFSTRLKREFDKLPYMRRGLSRRCASQWGKRVRIDEKNHRKGYTKETMRKLHEEGYLCQSVSKYGFGNGAYRKYVTDLDYVSLSPFNSTFSKWLSDVITTKRILKGHESHFARVHFSLIRRGYETLVLCAGYENRPYGVEDVIDLIKRQGVVELRPAHWISRRSRYKISYSNDAFFIDDRPSSIDTITKKINSLYANYVVVDYFDRKFAFAEDACLKHYIQLWIANDTTPNPQILAGEIHLRSESGTWYCEPLNVETGAFLWGEREVVIEGWENIRSELFRMSTDLEYLSYFTTTIALNNEDGFIYLSFSAEPKLPQKCFDDALNDYLKEKVEKKGAPQLSFGDHRRAYRSALFDRYVRKHCPKGMRPYMQKLWLRAVWDDLFHTKDATLRQKAWAWKRGYLSFRIWQYGLNDDNYMNFLSDYDYHWLNRINNGYQIWVNDKTTFRFTLDPFSEYIPKYYYSVFKRNGETAVKKMWDCPEGYEADFEEFCRLLENEGKLVFKPSAGTHGDGFYLIGYADGEITINEKASSKEELREVLTTQKSFYVVTEYVHMHPELKKIYPHSVNTIRVMVVNRHGYDPKIKQTYMRIGSSTTGFTDNVAYGGVCAMVELDTGRIYAPETLKNHHYQACPVHPDTGVSIEGYVPNWDIVCEKVLDICRYLCELEYLGFDIAVTEEGFQVLEINIHQDLHKVHLFDQELNDFFKDKIRIKGGSK